MPYSSGEITTAVNADYTYPCHNVHVSGVVNVQIAIPFSGMTGGHAQANGMIPLGIATDSIQITERGYYHDIPGDLNGGQQGPPIDIQKLGEVHTINLRMSSWDKESLHMLEQWFHTTRGTVQQDEVGQLMFGSNVFCRLLLETQNLHDTRNYWNCIMREPIIYDTHVSDYASVS